MATPSDLDTWLTSIRAQVQSPTYRLTDPIPGPDGTPCGVAYGEDDDGDEYVRVGFRLGVAGVFAEVEDDTYGTLIGFRIYTGNKMCQSCGARLNARGTCTWRHIDPHGPLRGTECDRPACPVCDELAPCDAKHPEGIAAYAAFLALPVDEA